jgi:hypothetical protein
MRSRTDSLCSIKDAEDEQNILMNDSKSDKIQISDNKVSVLEGIIFQNALESNSERESSGNINEAKKFKLNSFNFKVRRALI